MTVVAVLSFRLLHRSLSLGALAVAIQHVGTGLGEIRIEKNARSKLLE